MRQRAAILVAALPALALSAQFTYVLFAPLAWNNRQWAADAVALMALEFVMVHAGFMSLLVVTTGARARRIALAAALCAVYLMFIVAFSRLFGQLAMILAAAALLAGRLADAAASGQDGFTERAGVSVFSAFLYVIVVAGSTWPRFPAFGFTPEVLRELRPLLGDGRGLWERQPQRVVAAAAVYFLAQGLFELARLRHAREAPVGKAWTHIGHTDVRVLPDAVELRSSGEPGALIIGGVVGGAPLAIGAAMFFGARGVPALLGALLAATGVAFAVFMAWKSTRQVTVRAAPNRLEIRETLLWTARERCFGAAELGGLDLRYQSGGNDRPGIYRLVLRLPRETISLGAGLDSAQGYELMGLIQRRVRQAER